MKRQIILLVALSLGLLSLSAHAAACTNASLKGVFGFESAVLQNNEVPPVFGEFVGLMRFDGVGNASISFVVVTSDGGGDDDVVVSWSYRVAADCTFTATQDNGETFAGVLVRDGEEFFIVETSRAAFGTPFVRRGHAIRVRTRT